MILLPEWFRQIEEFKQIMAVEEKTLDEFEEDMKLVYRNHFIKTADREIISDYENWMNIRCQTGESLEYRRERVLQKLNTLPPFTIGFLRDRLNWMLGEDGYTLSVDSSNCILDIRIITDKPGAVDMVFELILDVVPAHMFIIMGRKFVDSYQVDIHTENMLTVGADFYPRYNIPFLMYDGTAKYNGKYRYNGYKTDGRIDLYPAGLSISNGYRAAPCMLPCLGTYDRAGQKVKGGDTSLTVLSEAGTEARLQSGMKMKQESEAFLPSYQINLTIGKHLTRYDGTYRYDGTRKYDSEIIHEVI